MTIASFFASGLAADVILLVLLLELVALSVMYQRTGRGIPPLDLVFSLGAGAGLVLAFRGALVGAGLGWIGAALLLSFALHIADQVRRGAGNRKSKV
jgi:hypothetical protein